VNYGKHLSRQQHWIDRFNKVVGSGQRVAAAKVVNDLVDEVAKIICNAPNGSDGTRKCPKGTNGNKPAGWVVATIIADRLKELDLPPISVRPLSDIIVRIATGVAEENGADLSDISPFYDTFWYLVPEKYVPVVLNITEA